MGIYEELVARGLIAQVTNEEEIREMINNGKATFYIGFDCTADSLTAGHFMACLLYTSTYSPIRGPEGNIEYLGYLKKCDEPDGSFDLPALVAESHSQLKD